MYDSTNASFVPTDEYIHCLQSVCGDFELSPPDKKGFIWGGLNTQITAGIELAHVATNLESAVRNPSNIRRDNGENYFLIMQQFGKALMSQNNASALLIPGDIVLIDSSRPSEFRFFGERAKQVSIHLPRQQVWDRFNQDLRGGTVLSQRNPNVRALQSVIEKLSGANTSSACKDYLHDALFGLIGLSIFDDTDNDTQSKSAGPDLDSALLSKFLDCLEAKFRDPEFSVIKMAAVHGVSVRKMQRLFESSGATPTTILISKRLEYARRRLEARGKCASSEAISSIAYDSGFSDISYFNRRFKQSYECSPRQYVNTVVERA